MKWDLLKIDFLNLTGFIDCGINNKVKYHSLYFNYKE